MESNQNIDLELWKKARGRARFKMHFFIYLIAIAFLWLIWAFVGYLYNWEYTHKWPLYPMLGWGLVILLHYLVVFRWRQRITQKEYEKLLNNSKQDKE